MNIRIFSCQAQQNVLCVRPAEHSMIRFVWLCSENAAMSQPNASFDLSIYQVIRRQEVIKVFCEERRTGSGYSRRFLAASYAALWAKLAATPVNERHLYEVSGSAMLPPGTSSQPRS
jgi:hypothetical protein